jgi:hypothetical protein
MKRIQTEARARRRELYPDEQETPEFKDEKMERFYNDMLSRVEDGPTGTSQEPSDVPALEAPMQQHEPIVEEPLDAFRPPVRSFTTISADVKKPSAPANRLDVVDAPKSESIADVNTEDAHDSDDDDPLSLKSMLKRKSKPAASSSKPKIELVQDDSFVPLSTAAPIQSSITEIDDLEMPESATDRPDTVEPKNVW